MTIGPVIGGLLARPCDLYPNLFKNNSLFQIFPYLLPNLVISIFGLISLLVVVIYLPETLPDDLVVSHISLPNCEEVEIGVIEMTVLDNDNNNKDIEENYNNYSKTVFKLDINNNNNNNDNIRDDNNNNNNNDNNNNNHNSNNIVENNNNNNNNSFFNRYCKCLTVCGESNIVLVLFYYYI